MHFTQFFVTLVSLSMSLAGTLHEKRATYTGAFATFNNYSGQHNTVCGPKSATARGAFGAAAADFSRNISPGHCDQTSANTNNCDGHGGFVSTYKKPSCPAYLANKSKGCGACWKVTNEGSMDPNATTGGVKTSVIVQIIDACPAYSAENYCKIGIAPEGRCGAIGKDALDIDFAAYPALTGRQYQAGVTPNLKISITSTACP